MHAPETLCLAKQSCARERPRALTTWRAPQKVDRPVDPHLAKTLS